MSCVSWLHVAVPKLSRNVRNARVLHHNRMETHHKWATCSTCVPGMGGIHKHQQWCHPSVLPQAAFLFVRISCTATLDRPTRSLNLSAVACDCRHDLHLKSKAIARQSKIFTNLENPDGRFFFLNYYYYYSNATCKRKTITVSTQHF